MENKGDNKPHTINALTAAEQLHLHQLTQVDAWVRSQVRDEPVASAQSPTKESISWKINTPARPWQEAALRAYEEAGFRGIAKVVTGAGKTIFALRAAAFIHNKVDESLILCVVVPSLVLQDQWVSNIRDVLNLPPEEICTIGGRTPTPPSPRTRAIVAVLNSAAAKLPELVSKNGWGERILLVVDECHRSGSKEYRRIFECKRKFSLGLSATPERDDHQDGGDDDSGGFDDQGLADEAYLSGDHVLELELGPIFFELSYDDAVRTAVLPPFTIEHYGLSLIPSEAIKYENLSREITDLRRELERPGRKGSGLFRWAHSSAGRKDAKAVRFIGLTTERKRLLYAAGARIEATIRLIDQAMKEDPSAQIILFHESIDEVMRIFDILRLKGYAAVAEHSRFPDSMRAHSIRLFRSGEARIIVSARSLIEGFDVPAVDMGIVVAASSSVRQRVQTLGRILRVDSQKKSDARLIVLYIKNTADESIYEKNDWGRFTGASRNRYFTWPRLDEPAENADGPPRVRKPDEMEIATEHLRVGQEYPGAATGEQYSVDTNGSVRAESGDFLHPTDSLRQILANQIQGGGRFFITPKQRNVLKFSGSGNGAKLFFLGKLHGDAFDCKGSPTQADLQSLQVGDVFPFTFKQKKVYSLLQRDSRLLAEKTKGQVKFVKVPDATELPEENRSTVAVLRALESLAKSGKKPSKLIVADGGLVLVPVDSAFRFLGYAPRGEGGFFFEH